MSVVSERPTGNYPLSIATSLALEGAMGVHPDHPAGKYLLKDFQHVRANVKTLFRNFYEAIERENFSLANNDELAEAFYNELLTYRDIVSSETGGKTKVQFYICDYLGVERRARWVLLRGDRTPNQLMYTKAMVMVLSEVFRADPDIAKKYRFKIEEEKISERVLIQTHFPVDLTNTSYSNQMLLESHTGVIKDRSMWYTKYYRGKELTQMPFREDFLYIFGDSYMFHPLNHLYRKTLIELAEKYNWSFATTREKIVYGLDSLKDKHLAETLKMYLL